MVANNVTMTNEQYQNLISLANANQEKANTYNKIQYGAGLASSFSNMAGSFIDYATLRADASNLNIQAGNVELQAKQRANQLRQQFIESAGAYMFGAAQRGIAVQSSSVQANLQRSSEALGKDIQTMEQNADLQASALRTQSKIAKIKARAGLVSGVASGIAGIGLNTAGFMGNTTGGKNG